MSLWAAEKLDAPLNFDDKAGYNTTEKKYKRSDGRIFETRYPVVNYTASIAGNSCIQRKGRDILHFDRSHPVLCMPEPNPLPP